MQDLARVATWDSDGNGWDDLWEALFGGLVDLSDPDFDTDGDGWTNYWEMVRFQDPLAPDAITSGSRRVTGGPPSPLAHLPAFGSPDQSQGIDTPPFLGNDGLGVPLEVWLGQRKQREESLRNDLRRTDQLRAARVAAFKEKELQRLALVSQDAVNRFLADPRVPYDVQDGQPLVMRSWSLTQAYSMGVQYIWDGQALFNPPNTPHLGLTGPIGTRIGLFEPGARPVKLTGLYTLVGSDIYLPDFVLDSPSSFRTSDNAIINSGWRIDFLPSAASGSLQNYDIGTYHATECATILIGTGAAAPGVGASFDIVNSKGICPTARLLAGTAEALLADLARPDTQSPYGVQVASLHASSHSYGLDYGLYVGAFSSLSSAFDAPLAAFRGTITDSLAEDYQMGAYLETCHNIDKALFARPNLLAVWAAGNQRYVRPEGGGYAYVHGLGTSTLYTYGMYSENAAKCIVTNYRPTPQSNPTLCLYELTPPYRIFTPIAGSFTAPDGSTAIKVKQESPPVGFVSGPLTELDGDNHFGYDTISDWQCAKNVLTVGGIEVERVPIQGADPHIPGPNDVWRLSAFEQSSAGPVDDGRIKPEVVADAVEVEVASPGPYHGVLSAPGTSYAAPAVAGVAHLLARHYQATMGGERAKAATLKALLIHTADDLVSVPPGSALAQSRRGPKRGIADDSGQFTDGPDYRSGFGLVDAEEAAQLITLNGVQVGGIFLRPHLRQLVFTSGTPLNFTITAHGNGQPLKVTLAWTDLQVDVQGPTENRDTRLKNDFNLRVVGPKSGGPASFTFMPFKLNPDNPSAPATRADNSVDPVEHILIPAAEVVAGATYQVNITLKDVTLKPPLLQHDLSVVMSGNGPAPRPLGPQSEPLSIVSLSSLGFGGMTVVWRSVPGTAYRLERSTDLKTWTPAGVSPDYPAIGDTTTATYYPPSPIPQHLWLRVRTLQIP